MMNLIVENLFPRSEMVVFLTALLLARLTNKTTGPRFLNESKIAKFIIVTTYILVFIFSFVFIFCSRIDLDLIKWRSLPDLIVLNAGFFWLMAISSYPDVLRIVLFKFGRSTAGLLRDMSFNFLLYTGGYVIAIYNNLDYTEKLIYIILFVLNMYKVIYYRIVKDEFLYTKEILSVRSKFNKQAFILQPLFDYAFRSIIHLTLSSSVLCIALFFSGAGPKTISNQYFRFPEGDTDPLIVDTIYYFSIVGHTIGFGDILPINQISKLYSLAWGSFSLIVIGYIIVQLNEKVKAAKELLRKTKQ